MADPHLVSTTLCLAAASGIILILLSERLPVPSIAVLLLGGVALGPEGLGLIDPFAIGSGLEVLVSIAVAVILFEGGLTLDIRGYRSEPRVIRRLLSLGVVVTWFTATCGAHFIIGLSWEIAFVAGSLVIVTGPTVVSPLLRGMDLPSRLRNVLYWEAVLVDAVGVFLAVLSFEWVESSEGFPTETLARFGERTALGLLVGFVFAQGIVLALRKKWVHEHHANIAALGGVLLAVGFSNAILSEAGVLVAITAGLVISIQKPPELSTLRRFKLELTEAAIGLLFVLLAAKLRLASFLEYGPSLLLLIALMIVVARPLGVLISTWGEGFPWQERAFLAWLAPRGIVAASMASLFSLRLEGAGHSEAPFLEIFTYALIGVTVIGQGMTAAPLARALGLRSSEKGSWLIMGTPAIARALGRVLKQGGAEIHLVSTVESDLGRSDQKTDFLKVDPLQPNGLLGPEIGRVGGIVTLSGRADVDTRLCAVWHSEGRVEECLRWSEGTIGKMLAPELPALDVDSFSKGEVFFEAVPKGKLEAHSRFGTNFQPILQINEGEVSAVAASHSGMAQTVVVVAKRIPGLAGLVQDALVLPPEESDFFHVVRELLTLAQRDHAHLNLDDMEASLREREVSMPSTLGHGVAMPHLYHPGLSRSLAYVALVPEGLSSKTPDGVDVRLVFLILSPADHAEQHLQSLAAVARLCSEEGLRTALIKTRTRASLLGLLRERG